ncbi:ATP-dependent DNA ligase [Candidatus Microgenomates bacterium]|nr:ATP-dependent DNA ligase [Candidatus Microgenomates bacterium]
MTFKDLSLYFEKLENTASRNSMVLILAELFKEASIEEIDKVVYLTQGRVAPLYEPIEFGMAEKMVLRAMALAYNTSLEDVTASYKKVGDLGEVAEHLSSKFKSLKGLTVNEVFEKLVEITKTNGEGSVEKKIKILSDLFKESSALENRFLARIPVDKMRLGFSDMTVLEGLSWMLDGTKKHKDEIEAGYNIRPDLGFVAKAVKENKFLSITPVVGTPILVMRAERLKNASDIVEKMGGQAAVEPKIDGLRTQLHVGKEIRIYSRGLENVTGMYPDLVAAAKKELDGKEVILDGESIAFDPKTGKYLQFQETVQRKRKYDVDSFSVNVPLRLVAFDVLFYNGKSMLNEPYENRRKLLEELTKNGKIIVANKMDVVNDPKKLKDLFDEDIKKGLEGIMAKKLDGVYQAGARGWNWIKLKSSYEGKLTDTVDAVVMGYDFGQGKRNGFGVGAFLIGVYDQQTDSYKTISKVGTGLTDEEWRQLVSSSQSLVSSKKPTNYDVNKIMNVDVWLKPKLMGVFRADQITKSPMHTAGYALRFPRLDNWRADKQPEDSTSLKEIQEMVKLQK